MITDRLRNPRYQSDFYRDSYHKVLNGLIISCVIIVILIAAIIYFILFRAEPNYYGTSLGGQLIQMNKAP